jgi:predicted nucleic acid-binding protein
MRRAVLADTGPLYAAADADDAHHRRAQRELKRLARDKSEVLVAYPTLCEAYTLVLHRLGKAAASNWLSDMMTGVSPVNPAPEDYREARTKLSAFADQPITLFDATVAVLGGRLGVEIWTYDHHFDVMGAAVWRGTA